MNALKDYFVKEFHIHSFNWNVMYRSTTSLMIWLKGKTLI